ncbi:alpha/beta hydrolase [Acidocella aromatica]|uniref:Acetyl esterase/lipase n=1 Tax=Acidocella aromatica TaxID=1303579 RepID=A0A840VBZ8_9PROT|nr:alpha/beta hydrolase [Acidocella aromatica]MBB5373428.1 acetyl esterase/lipase [Acidocella aromatica]
MRAILALCAALLVVGYAGPELISPVTVLNSLAYGPYALTQNIPYAPGPRGGLDVYAPLHARNAPVVVFYYGGSWQSGDKAMYRFVGAALASRGVVAVIPDYRVYPQARFPGFLQDCAAAFAWAHSHAGAYGGDPGRIFVMGHSAGAYNAAMLALAPEWLAPYGLSPGRDVAGLIGLAGPYDFLPLTDPALKTIFGPPGQLARTQPINFVASGAPPAFLAAGTRDATVDPGNSARLARRLAQSGDAVELKLYPGIDHRRLIGAFSPLLRGLAPVLADSLDFITHTKPQSLRSAA